MKNSIIEVPFQRNFTPCQSAGVSPLTGLGLASLVAKSSGGTSRVVAERVSVTVISCFFSQLEKITALVSRQTT
jgi:hypothetical protein